MKWDVMTLLNPRKMQELADQRAKTQLEIVALQETRLSGTGQINKNDYILYYIIVDLTPKQAMMAQVSYS
jgi:hypothetical protein